MEHLQLPEQGTFFEVGAYDGKLFSNTLAFEEKGWTGVCVEPNLRKAAEARANRSCVVFACAAGLGFGTNPLYIRPEDQTHSTTRVGQAWPTELTLVLPLRFLFERLFIPDLLSIDTEGTELDVWESVGWFRPRILIIEHLTEPGPSRAEHIVRCLKVDGYEKVHQTEANLIFEYQGVPVKA
jgi:hypothetical protein